MDKNYFDNKSRAGWTENNKDNKTEGIDNADKKKMSGQKGIYHQVEFCPQGGITGQGQSSLMKM